MSRRSPGRLVLTLVLAAVLAAVSCLLFQDRDEAAAFTPDATMAREQIPARFQWKLDALFPDDALWEKALARVDPDLERLTAYAGKLADPAELLRCLDLYFDTRLAINRLTLYAAMRLDTAQKSKEHQEMKDRSLKALERFMGRTTFVREEVLSLDDAAMAAAYDKAPGLAAHRRYLEELRRRRSRLVGPEAEKLLSLAGDNLWAEIDLNEIPSDHEKAFLALLMDLKLPEIEDEAGKPVQMTLSSYGRYRGSKDRRVRKDAVEALFGTLFQYRHALAATLAGQVRFSVFLARARGYATALEAYLDKDGIDPAVYHNLLAAVGDNLAPLHDYIRLQKEMRGLDELRVYDLYDPLVEEVSSAIPYEEACRVVPEALAPLGQPYVEVLRFGLDPAQGWVDVYPHRDKESGASVGSVHGVHPFVRLNYQDQLGDLSTLAHEVGHAVHAHLAMEQQPYATFNAAPFVAEIASTLNEKLLSDYLLANAGSEAEKLYLLGELAATIRTTLYRQALFAEFELAAHTATEKGEPVTADSLIATYERLLRTYYGPALTLGEHDGIEWAYVPHFYYKYYLSTYATGLSAAIALSDRLRTGGPAAREAILDMLRAGASKPPLELLKGAGVDLTKPDAVQAAARLLGETVKALRAGLAKKKGTGGP